MTLQKILACTAMVALVFSDSLLGASAKLTQDEKDELLNAHNYYRRSVTPIASNMEKMVVHVP